MTVIIYYCFNMNLDLTLKPDRLLNVFKTEEQGEKTEKSFQQRLSKIKKKMFGSLSGISPPLNASHFITLRF